MITEDQKQTVLKGLKVVFPSSNPKVNAKAGGGAYAITTEVPLIYPANFKDLSDLVASMELKINVTIKKADAGISIVIN